MFGAVFWSYRLMHTNNEEYNVDCIALVVKKLGLNTPLICGASIAGQAYLAVAMQV